MPKEKEKATTITCRFGHKIKVAEWPSSEGMATLRRHYKRKHPKVFAASIRKGVKTRKERRK